jgi:flagellar basal-body rod protein FlgF
MANGIYVALSGAVAQSDALDVTASNVANASTVGYQAERLTFGESLGRARAKDVAYVTPAKTVADPTAGTVTRTDNPLDMAVSGDGYFAVDTPRGVRYTRAGNFRLDGNGTLVSADGFAVRARGGGKLTIPPGSANITVSPDGTVAADGTEVGAVDVARFVPGALARDGRTLYAATAAPAVANPSASPPEVMSGALEQGNVNVVRGMIDLVRVSRTYEALHRMIESYKEIDERTARDLGGK